MIVLTLPGNPVTKKNSSRIVKDANGKPHVLPSKQYNIYASKCYGYLKKCKLPEGFPIREPVNVQCVYYMKTKRRVDLCNLLEGTLDILTAAGILLDDCADIVASHDGCRVMYDKENPRVEIRIIKQRHYETIVEYRKRPETIEKEYWRNQTFTYNDLIN